MRVQFTLVSRNGALLRLVSEFAQGLGWTVEAAPTSAISVFQSDGQLAPDHLVRLLTYVGLAAAKTGVDSSEPLCEVTYREDNAAAQVTMGLRIAHFDMKG
jgi:hypothetical protein